MSSNKSNPKVVIIILNWNGYDDTVECINSIKSISYDNYRIVLVDNGSESDEIEKLLDYSSEIQLIKSKINLGFSGGNNLGINYSLELGADFTLLLNNDTIVEPDFLEPLIQVFQNNNQVGIAAPQINYYSQKNKIWTSGGKISKLRGSGFAYSDEIDNGIRKGNKVVSFVSGCCMLISNEIFKKVGLFDEIFFLYVEDADFCVKTIKAGYKIFVSNDSKIYHKIGSSAGKDTAPLPLYYVTRNRLYFTKKQFGKVYYFTFMYLLISMTYKAILWILKGKRENICSVLNAFYDFYQDNLGKTNHSKFVIK